MCWTAASRICTCFPRNAPMLESRRRGSLWMSRVHSFDRKLLLETRGLASNSLSVSPISPVIWPQSGYFFYMASIHWKPFHSRPSEPPLHFTRCAGRKSLPRSARRGNRCGNFRPAQVGLRSENEQEHISIEASHVSEEGRRRIGGQ